MLGFTVYSHVAPLGLGYLMYRVFYKHAAPLGLKTRFLAFPFSLRALCLCGAFITHHASQKSVQSNIYVNRSLRLCRRFWYTVWGSRGEIFVARGATDILPAANHLSPAARLP